MGIMSVQCRKNLYVFILSSSKNGFNGKSFTLLVVKGVNEEPVNLKFLQAGAKIALGELLKRAGTIGLEI